MQVRQLNGADAEEYRRLRLEGLRDTPTAFGSSYEESEHRPLEEYARRLEPTERTAVFGAFDHGALVGTVGVYRETGLKERHKAVLWGMYVTSSSRRGGIGRLLVRSALEAVRTLHGVIQVKLAAESTNEAAIALYGSFGFRAYGREERALFVDGRYYDELHMVVFLDGYDQASVAGRGPS
jgi:RimJ/RimL family protein N-acetyltransferase